MTGFIILCAFVVICALTIIIFRGKIKKNTSLGIILSLVMAISITLIAYCTIIDFPELWLLSVGIGIIAVVAFLTTIPGRFTLLFTIPFILAQLVFPIYEIKQIDDETYALCGKFTHWITGKENAVGKEIMPIEVIESRGYYSNHPRKKTYYILKDAQGYISIFPGDICSYDDKITQYQILFYNDSESSVDVIKLINKDGACVIKDFQGRDTSSDKYSPPDSESDAVIYDTNINY